MRLRFYFHDLFLLRDLVELLDRGDKKTRLMIGFALNRRWGLMLIKQQEVESREH